MCLGAFVPFRGCFNLLQDLTLSNSFYKKFDNECLVGADNSFSNWTMLNEKFEMWRLTEVTEFGDNEEPLATVAEGMEARARSK